MTGKLVEGGIDVSLWGRAFGYNSFIVTLAQYVDNCKVHWVDIQSNHWVEEPPNPFSRGFH